MRATRYDPSDPARWWRDPARLPVRQQRMAEAVAYRLGLGGEARWRNAR